MKEITFIDGKKKIRIKDKHLASYLERIEAAGYEVKANKCRSNERFLDILMIGRSRDFEEFFSGRVRIKEIFRQFSQVYRLMFDEGELILYILQEHEIA